MLSKSYIEQSPSLRFNQTLLHPQPAVKQSADVVGSWTDPSPFGGGTYTLRRIDGKLHMQAVFADGSKRDQTLAEEKHGAETRLTESQNEFGEYYLVAPDGLSIYDKEGFIKRLAPR